MVNVQIVLHMEGECQARCAGRLADRVVTRYETGKESTRAAVPGKELMAEPFLIEALAAHHDRTGFSCGVEALDRYFQKQVTHDVRRRATACYVATDVSNAKVAGYYTLAAAGIPLADMPSELARRLPRYRSVPVARLGRLAVDAAYHGRKLGSALLWDAIGRSLRSEVAVFALVVDAKDDQAEAFYRHQGFVAFGSQARQLVLPLTSPTLKG
jgi:ribosomal protein S18 acetylase RimI-like enzyme